MNAERVQTINDQIAVLKDLEGEMYRVEERSYNTRDLFADVIRQRMTRLESERARLTRKTAPATWRDML